MTKIASIATYPVSVPRPVPVWTAHERSTAWSAILTEVKTDDGLTGHGIIHAAPRRGSANGWRSSASSSAAWTRWPMSRCGSGCSR